MVTATPALTVRTVGPDDFNAIYPLLQLFDNKKMSEQDWRAMIFDYRWWHGPERGFALYAGETAVGFFGTIFSKRRVLGREETFCNTACWIVREEFRAASMLLLKPILGLRNCTLVNYTPNDRAYQIFKKLGFIELESEQLFLHPLTTLPSLLGGSVVTDDKPLRRILGPDETRIYTELEGTPKLKHFYLKRGHQGCYVVATRSHAKRIPIAEIQHISNPRFFVKNIALMYRAATQHLGAVGLALDRRLLGQEQIPTAYRRTARRLYRPGAKDIVPSVVDNLFSELMILRV